jgi:hypothetical protein
MGELTREELAAMTDQELLAYEREHHGNPYMTLAKAKAMQRVALQFGHLGAAKKKMLLVAPVSLMNRLRFTAALPSTARSALATCSSMPRNVLRARSWRYW